MRSKALERVRNAIARRHRQPAEVEGQQDRPRSPWLSFRYAYRSVTADDKQAHLVAREARFEDGKLETEELEATLDRHAAAELFGAMQRLLQERASALLRPLSSLLLAPRRRGDRQE